MQTLKEQIESQLVNYYGNTINMDTFIERVILPHFQVSVEKIEEIQDLVSESQFGWDNLDCDIEGATTAQQKEIDRFLSETIDTIIEICLK